MNRSFIGRLTALGLTVLLVAILAAEARTAHGEGAEVYTLFSYDFENDPAGQRPPTSGTNPAMWQAQVSSAESTLLVVEDNGSKVLEYARVSTATGYGGPRMEKRLIADDESTVRIDLDVKTQGYWFRIELRSEHPTVPASTFVLGLNGDGLVANPPAGAEFDPHTYVRATVVIDFNTHTYSSWLNGIPIVSGQPLHADLDLSMPVRFRLIGNLLPGQAVYLDNVSITTENEGLVHMQGTDYQNIDLSALVADTDQPLVPYLRDSHPRLFVTDFTAIQQKVAADPLAQAMADYVRADADQLLTVPPQTYAPASNHILPISKNVVRIVNVLGLMYKLDGNTAYLERLWAELESAASFPSWHPNSFLSTAEMVYAFGLAYDWLYNDWTQQQRDVMLNAMLEKAIKPAVYHYTIGTIGQNFVHTTSNWNLVSNGSLIVAALAIADEVPNVSEFILDKAAASIQNGLQPYAPDGAYPEGLVYWQFGTSYLVNAMASLDSAIDDGYTLPAKFQFYNAPGLASTPDFPVYMNAPTNPFNFGDASIGRGSVNNSAMYWFAGKFNKPQYAWFKLTFDLELNFGSASSAAKSLLYYDPTYLTAAPDFDLDKAYTRDHGFNGVVLRSDWENGAASSFIGIQGGYNGTDHMFLSLGTFLLEASGERWSTMRGMGNYSWPGYHTTANYYHKRAEGQNTLVINPGAGPDQNPEAVARTIAFETSEGEAFGILDLTEAYDHAVNSAKRGIRLFDNRSRMLVQDEVEAKAPIQTGYWFMHTRASVQISADGKSAILTQNGKRMWANISEGPASAVFTVMDAKPLPTSPDPDIQQSVNYGHKLAIEISGVQYLKLAVEFVPLAPGEDPPAASLPIPDLADWHIDEADEPAEEEASITSLQSLVEHYAASSDLRTPMLNMLRNALKQAEHHLEKNHVGQAMKFLDDFLKHLNRESLQHAVSENARQGLDYGTKRVMNALDNQ